MTDFRTRAGTAFGSMGLGYERATEPAYADDFWLRWLPVGLWAIG